MSWVNVVDKGERRLLFNFWMTWLSWPSSPILGKKPVTLQGTMDDLGLDCNVCRYFLSAEFHDQRCNNHGNRSNPQNFK